MITDRKKAIDRAVRVAYASGGAVKDATTADVNEILSRTVADRGTIVPLVEYADGSFGLGVPGAIMAPIDAASRMLTPGYDYDNIKQAVGDALAASSLGVTGGMAGRMAARGAASAAPSPVSELPAHLRPQSPATRVAEYSAQRMVPDDTASITLQRAYDDFRAWSAANGQRPVSFDEFRLAMQDSGFMPQHIAGSNRFVGVGVPDPMPARGVQRFGDMPALNPINDDLRGPWLRPTDFARGGSVAMDRATRLAYATGGTVEPPTVTGPLHSEVPGRTDHLAIDVPAGSYILPADVVSGLGEGNTSAGTRLLNQMFKGGVARTQRAAGGRVPIMAAGGEFVVSPEEVEDIGGGDLEKGHAILDAFVKRTRAQTIEDMTKLPGPVK